MPDYLLTINNQVLLCYFISKNPVSRSKGDKEMKSKKYGIMLAVLAAAGGVSASAARNQKFYQGTGDDGAGDTGGD